MRVIRFIVLSLWYLASLSLERLEAETDGFLRLVELHHRTNKKDVVGIQIAPDLVEGADDASR